MLLELSYVFGIDEPKWPTNPTDSFVLDASTRRGDVNNCSTITHHMHNGTHMDAPLHFAHGGKSVDQLPIEDFLYESALCVKLPKGKGERITKDDLVKIEGLQEADLLMLYTGFADLRSEDPAAFIDDFPCFAKDAALYLRKECPKLKAVAMDMLSVDSCVSGAAEGFPAHHSFLERNQENPERTLILFEDVNTKKMYEAGVQPKRVYAFPPRFKGLEAAPIAMVAEV